MINKSFSKPTSVSAYKKYAYVHVNIFKYNWQRCNYGGILKWIDQTNLIILTNYVC